MFFPERASGIFKANTVVELGPSLTPDFRATGLGSTGHLGSEEEQQKQRYALLSPSPEFKVKMTYDDPGKNPMFFSWS